LKNHTSNPVVKVTGKMNENDAGTVGKRYAAAAILFAVAALVYAVRWW